LVENVPLKPPIAVRGGDAIPEGGIDRPLSMIGLEGSSKEEVQEDRSSYFDPQNQQVTGYTELTPSGSPSYQDAPGKRPYREHTTWQV
jgi:hypothetical protein